MKNLIINNLSKMYNEQKGIKDINITLEDKRCMAILGKSGSGKSTLLKCIINELAVDTGKITILNGNLKDDYTNIMRDIGYLPDYPYNFPSIKIKDFIKTINKYYNLDYTLNITNYLKLFNLDINQNIYDLSSGEKQKLSLILAFFHKPKLLLLDEPTNFLDNNSIHTLTNILKQLKYEGTSIIIVSHSLNFTIDLADDIYLLNDNTILDIKNKIMKKDYKKVTIALKDMITYKDLNLKGLSNISLNNETASFIYAGEMTYLLKKLSNFNLLDIEIESPTIEEIIGGLLNDL